MLSELPFPMPVLETQRLRLRRFEQRDLEAGFAWASDEEVTRYVYWPAHRTLDDTQSFLNFCFQEYSQKGVGPWAMVLKDSGEQIGNCSFGLIHAADSRIEIAYFLARHHWGKGLACEAVTELLRFGFEDLQANRMEARCIGLGLGSVPCSDPKERPVLVGQLAGTYVAAAENVLGETTR